jgi:hypothetical protein
MKLAGAIGFKMKRLKNINCVIAGKICRAMAGASWR